MGVCGSKNSKSRGVMRMIIAGPPECGKTTISKQMQIVNSGDEDEAFSTEDKENYRRIIFMNIIEALVSISRGRRSQNLTNSDIDDISNGTDATSTNDNGSKIDSSAPVEKAMRTLAKLESKYKATYEIHSDATAKKHMRELFNNGHFTNGFEDELAPIKYFIDNSDRIFAEGYEPSNDDILRARRRTVGVRVTEFSRNNYDWELYDVGGQINERRKWPDIINDNPCIAVLFCASLGDMDIHILEGKKRPLFDITVELFDSMMAQEYTDGKTVVLFLNKTDVFKEKLKNGDIKMNRFPDFKGPSTYENGLKYFEDLFTNLASKRNRPITVHATCALDTEQSRVVLDSITRDIISTRLINSNL